MLSRKWLPCIVTILGLSGCATTYHSANNPILGLTGGYWDQPGPGELVKVGFAGNGYSKRDTVAPFIMYHCAELAGQRHDPYFRMYYTLFDAIRDKPIDQAIVGRVGNGLGDWVFVLFDKQYEPGDLSAIDTLKKYDPIVHGQGEAP